MSPRLFKSSQIWSLCLLHRIQSIKSRQFFIEHLFTLFHPDATCPTFVDFRFQDRRNIYQLLFQPSPLHRHLLCLKIYFFVLNCRRACNQIWRNLRISKFVNWNAKTCDAISLILVLFYILNQGSHGFFFVIKSFYRKNNAPKLTSAGFKLGLPELKTFTLTSLVIFLLPDLFV